MQEKQLKRLSKRFEGKIIMSLDSTSYWDIFAGPPLLLHIDHTGEFLDSIFRIGSVFLV